MVALSESSFITPEEYLELEDQSQIRHEYINGKMYAVSGSTDIHNLINLNMYMPLRNHLRGTDFWVYCIEVKLRIEEQNCFYYPDVMVTGDRRDRETPVYKRFPKLIIEVLSPSTEGFDRGDKFSDYQTLETLQEYVLVNTKQQRVEIFRRTGDRQWSFESYSPDSETFPLQSLDLNISFPKVYENTDIN